MLKNSSSFSWEKFYNAVRTGIPKNDRQFLNEIEGIGQLMVVSLMEFFSDYTEREKLEDLLNYVNIENIVRENKIETAITNKKLVLTGTFNGFSRAELKSICEKNGAKVLTALSTNVDLLVVGQSPGSKVKKASELGVKQIFEEEFKTEVGTRGFPEEPVGTNMDIERLFEMYKSGAPYEEIVKKGNTVPDGKRPVSGMEAAMNMRKKFK